MQPEIRMRTHSLAIVVRETRFAQDVESIAEHFRRNRCDVGSQVGWRTAWCLRIDEDEQKSGAKPPICAHQATLLVVRDI